MSKKKSRSQVWQETQEKIADIYPHLSNVNFDKELFIEDPMFMTRIINDVLKFDSRSSASGKRPPLTLEQAKKEFISFIGEDYASVPFVDAFNILKQDDSVRKVAAKCGLDKSMVQLLLTGKREPDLKIMEKIARGYGKKPDFFMEYRLMFIFGVLLEKFYDYPDSLTIAYGKVK